MCDPFTYQLGNNMIMVMEGVGWLKGRCEGSRGDSSIEFLGCRGGSIRLHVW